MKNSFLKLYARWLKHELAGCNKDAEFHMEMFQAASNDAARITAALHKLKPVTNPQGDPKLPRLGKSGGASVIYRRGMQA